MPAISMKPRKLAAVLLQRLVGGRRVQAAEAAFDEFMAHFGTFWMMRSYQARPIAKIPAPMTIGN